MLFVEGTQPGDFGCVWLERVGESYFEPKAADVNIFLWKGSAGRELVEDGLPERQVRFGFLAALGDISEHRLTSFHDRQPRKLQRIRVFSAEHLASDAD